jgi:hypothetical protein
MIVNLRLVHISIPVISDNHCAANSRLKRLDYDHHDRSGVLLLATTTSQSRRAILSDYFEDETILIFCKSTEFYRKRHLWSFPFWEIWRIYEKEEGQASAELEQARRMM